MAAPTVAMSTRPQRDTSAWAWWERLSTDGGGEDASQPLQKEDFADPIGLAVGLFCTWALDTRRLLAFMAERVDVDRIVKMDVPPPPAEVMVVETDQATLEFPLSEIRTLIPNSCSICTDLTAELSTSPLRPGRPGRI